MEYKVGDIIVTGTDSSPIVSEVVEVLESYYRVHKLIYSLVGKPWKRFDLLPEPALERKSDVKRLATPQEIDAFLDFYNK